MHESILERKLDKILEIVESNAEGIKSNAEAIKSNAEAIKLNAEVIKSNKQEIENLARMTAEGFARIDTELKVIKEETATEFEKVNRKIDGLTNRIDDLALNKANVASVNQLENRVVRLEEKSIA